MKVLFFAQLKDVTGCSEASIDCDSINTDNLWRMLIQLYPGLSRFRNSVRLAKNWEYSGPKECFNNSDEVALIPPVSGG